MKMNFEYFNNNIKINVLSDVDSIYNIQNIVIYFIKKLGAIENE